MVVVVCGCVEVGKRVEVASERRWHLRLDMSFNLALVLLNQALPVATLIALSAVFFLFLDSNEPALRASPRISS